MKKVLLLVLVLSLCLAGCGKKSEAASHTFQDLTIQIPADYINLSDEEFAQGLDFVFGLDPVAINGLREEKATFQAYGLELDLQRYGELLMLSNKVSTELTEKDGILHFSYASGEFTYVVTLHENDTAFWTVQAYCPTEDYAKVKKDIWEILSSVTV